MDSCHSSRSNWLCAPGRRARRVERLALALLAVFALVGGTLVAAPVVAAPLPEVALVLRDHRFAPAEVTVPAGTRVRLVIDNQDPSPEEFDSHALNREKVIPGGTTATIYVGPLAPGRYEFIGEFNAATARGSVVAK